MNCKTAASFLLYQNIKSRVTEISESKEMINKLKEIFFNKILSNINGCNELVIQRICFCISILVLGGILNYWQTAIEDILSFSSGSNEQCYLSIIILSNISVEYSSINTTQKFMLMIRDVLIDKKELIKNFIFSIMTNSENIPDEAIRKKMFEKVLELTQSWIKFDLNVLQMNFLAEKFVNQINVDNIEKISELLSECISNSKSAKIYSDYPPVEGEELEFLNDMFKKTNQVEIESINHMIAMISNFSSNYNPKNDPDSSLITGIANIFASISENFIYLFFAKNEYSQKLLQLLYFFISCKKRRVSYKFFETICELREFVNTYYKFVNLSDQEKKEFIDYLIKINESVMINSKLKKLDVNYDLMLKKDILCLNISSGTNSLEKMRNENEIELDTNEISVTDYRESADDVFYNIFIILVHNFGEQGGNIYLSKIMEILSQANINDESILNDSNRLLAVETAFFVMRAITESFETLEISNKPILEFTQCVLKSYLIKNNKMVVNFLLFLDQASVYIPKDPEVYRLTILFLLKISEEEILEKISTLIIYNITMFSNEPNANLFQAIYDFYIKKYDYFKEKTSCSNISLALCCCIGNKDYSVSVKQGLEHHSLPLEELIKYYSLVMQPATEHIKKLGELVNKNMNDSKVKLEIIKNYEVHQNVLQRAYEYNKDLYYYIFNLHFTETFNVTRTIFEHYAGNEEMIISELTGIYVKNANYLGNKSLDYFDQLTELMMKAFLASKMNYKSLIVLKYLFGPYAEVNQNNNLTVQNLFFQMCKQMIINIIKEEKCQIEMLKIFAEFFYYTFPKLVMQNSQVENLSLLNDIIKVFIQGLTFNENTLTKALIKSLSSFVSNEYLSKETISSNFTFIISSVFNMMDNFDSDSVEEFVNLISNAIAFNKQQFLFVLNEILNNEKFNRIFKKEYITLIIDYFDAFGENDSKILRLIKVIVEITQGKSRADPLNFFGVELARKKMNINNS